jgi:hypothetical protein
MTEPNRLRITIHKKYMLQLVIHTMATKRLGAQKGAYFLFLILNPFISIIMLCFESGLRTKSPNQSTKILLYLHFII